MEFIALYVEAILDLLLKKDLKCRLSLITEISK